MLHKADLAIIGGGLQAITLAVALERYKLMNWVMIDPDPPGSKWFELTAKQGMARLRTSSGAARHVDYGDGNSLLRYINRTEHPIAPWLFRSASDTDEPFLSYFNGHVRNTIDRWHIRSGWLAGNAIEVERKNRGFSIATDSGPHLDRDRIYADQVVVATGLGKPKLPTGVHADGKIVMHSDQFDINNFRKKGPVCVVGGGMTAATIALSLMKRGFKVTLCMQSMTTSQLEADPAWLPGGELHKQFLYRYPFEERIRLISSARQGRGLTPEKTGEILRYSYLGSLKVKTGFTLEKVEQDSASVYIPGVGDFCNLICCTGYKADVRDLTFLESLLPQIGSVEGLPQLTLDLQCVGVPGLYFMGRLSELQSGPFGRNIPGAWWSTEQILHLKSYGS